MSRMGAERVAGILASLSMPAALTGASMGDWFRNTEWDDAIEAAFDARLARARNKVQYLNIQAYTLLATQPEAAARLARRAIACAEASETARAGLYLGTALAVAGDPDGAIAALEGAIEAERREPMFRTAAHLDQALLIALAKRADLYDLALQRLAGEQALPLRDQHLSALLARVLIGSERGEDVAEAASLALDMLGGPDGEEAVLPPYLAVDALRNRLAAARR